MEHLLKAKGRFSIFSTVHDQNLHMARDGKPSGQWQFPSGTLNRSFQNRYAEMGIHTDVSIHRPVCTWPLIPMIICDQECLNTRILLILVIINIPDEDDSPNYPDKKMGYLFHRNGSFRRPCGVDKTQHGRIHFSDIPVALHLIGCNPCCTPGRDTNHTSLRREHLNLTRDHID